jgi:hypothetical protein
MESFVRSQARFAIHLSLLLCFSINSCSRTQTSSQPVTPDVVAPVREYAQTYKSGQLSVAGGGPTEPGAASEKQEDGDVYEARIRAYFDQQDFDQLEKAAREARTGKGRVVGGVWKLYAFYEGLTENLGGRESTEDDFTYRFAILKKWINARPDSVTVRIAMAQTYLNYGWLARGSGYADQVTGNGWELFRERAEQARSMLVGAAHLKEKCPYWFEVMQHVSLAQGWDKSQAKELLDLAVSIEPEFYHFYREYAYFLEPRWYGEEGETEEFAEDVSNRLGGQQGDFIYFEIASLLTCQCNADPSHIAIMSWPKIKQGYAALGQLYGVSNLKRNRFAYMAFLAGDRPAARDAFVTIGGNWNREIWKTEESFEGTKAWATGL